MPILACIDTNVLISMFISARSNSPVVKIFEEIVAGRVIPLISEEIFLEYAEVSARPKFNIPEDSRLKVLGMLKQRSIIVNPERDYKEILQEKMGLSFDIGDVPFYVITMEKQGEGAYLVTGNLKHFPREPFIVSPKEFLKILQQEQR